MIQMCCIDEEYEIYYYFFANKRRSRYILILLPGLTLGGLSQHWDSGCFWKEESPCLTGSMLALQVAVFCSRRWKIHQAQMEVEKNSQTSKLEISNISSFIEIRITVNDFPMCTTHEKSEEEFTLFLLNVAMTHFPQCTCSMAPLQWSIIQHCQNKKGKWNGFSNES